MGINLVTDNQLFRTGFQDKVCKIRVTISKTDSTIGGSDGIATAVVTGGVGTVTFVWSTGETTSTITGLGAGQVYVTVYDDAFASGSSETLCTDRAHATIFASLIPLAFTFSSTNAVSSTFTIVYSGTGDPEWSDGATTETGVSITFSGGLWNGSTQKDVVVRCDEPDKITAFSITTWNSKKLAGTLDISRLTGLAGDFIVQSNSGLLTILNPTTSNVFTSYKVNSNGLTGTLDLSGLTGLGGLLFFSSNSSLTGVTFPTSSQVISQILLQSCNLTGTLDLSPLSKLGGSIMMNSNPLLTAITNPTSSQVFSNYIFNNCDITGTIDVSGLTKLGGSFTATSNPNLTGITSPTSSEVFISWRANSCDITGTIDLSGLTGLGGTFFLSSNSNLTGITLPTTTQTFSNILFSSCDLDYVDVSVMSNMMKINNGNYAFEGNNMVVADVNHILFDMAALVAGEGGGGDFTGRNANISGSNAAPDGSSGGFDGDASVITLVSKSVTTTTS